MAEPAENSGRSRFFKTAALGGGTALTGGFAYMATQSSIVAAGFAIILALIMCYLIFLAVQRVYPRIKTGKWELGFERLPKHENKDVD